MAHRKSWRSAKTTAVAVVLTTATIVGCLFSTGSFLPVVLAETEEGVGTPSQEFNVSDGSSGPSGNWDETGESDYFTIEFDPKGGSRIEPITDIPGGSYLTGLQTPVRDGYLFIGWYKDTDGNEIWDETTDTVNRNLTLYAKWDEDKDLDAEQNGAAAQVRIPIIFIAKDDSSVEELMEDLIQPEAYVMYTAAGEEIPALEVPQLNADAFDESGEPYWEIDCWYADPEGTIPYAFDAEAITEHGEAPIYGLFQQNPSFSLIPKNVKVTFLSEGRVYTETTVKRGEKVEAPEPPEREGYTFDGWYTDKLLLFKYDFSKNVQSNMTLHAKWTKVKTYTVSFMSNGGTSVSPIRNVPAETRIDQPADPIRSNYDFDGWYKDIRLTQPWDFGTDTVEKDTTLYAKWLRTYTVYFVTNYGTSVAPLYNVRTGSTITTPEEPTRKGYTFDGWYKDITLIRAWNFDKDTVTSTTTLYAKWKVAPKTYTVTFDTVGGTFIESYSEVVAGTKIDPPAVPEKDGHEFEGWYKGRDYSTAWVFERDTITRDTTLYAKWKAVPKMYTVTFNSNGGSAIGSYENILDGDKIKEPEPPERDGYDFDGWFKDEKLIRLWNFGEDTVTENITLYAKWTKVKTYTVSFITSGGTYISPIREVSKGETITAPADPQKAGHNFHGWYKDARLTKAWDFETDTVERDTILYAKWVKSYTVYFVSNLGTPVAPIHNVEKGATIEQPQDPTLKDHVFDGWYKDIKLTKKWNFEADVVTGTTVLYAKWQYVPKTYTVTFETNGGTPVESYTGVPHGEKIEAPQEPAKEGYVFDGWYKDAKFSHPWDFSKDSVTKDITLYAKWVKTYTVYFVSGLGTPVAPIYTVPKGATIEEPAEPSLLGHRFDGWYQDICLKQKWDFDTDTVTGITVLYAKWTKVSTHTVHFNSNWGSHVDSIYRVEHGATIDEPAPPTRRGYEFDGWYKDSRLTNPWDFEKDTVKKTMTLYAKWRKPDAETFMVTFDVNGGDSGNTTVKVPNGERAVPPETNPTRIGYRFTGWYTEAECITLYEFTTPVTRDIRLYAGWGQGEYTVRFLAEYEIYGPGYYEEVDRKTVVGGDTVIPPDELLITLQKRCVGWSAERGSDVPFDFKTAIVRDMELWAIWEETHDVFSIHFNTMGGNQIASILNVPYGSFFDGVDLQYPDVPKRAGYSFDGWYKEAECINPWLDTDHVVSNITLYAGWTDASEYLYTVKFNTDGGSFIPNYENIPYNGTINKPVPDPVKPGYIFNGWYTGYERGGRITLDTRWSFELDTVFSNMTLYAEWIDEELEMYLIQFSILNGTDDSDDFMLEDLLNPGDYEPVFVVEGHTVDRPRTPEFRLYEDEQGNWIPAYLASPDWLYEAEEYQSFVTRTAFNYSNLQAWDFINNPVTGPLTLGNLTVSNSFFQGTMCAVTFDYQYNGIKETKHVLVNSVLETLPVPDFINPGYQFVGWFTDASGTSQFLAGSAVHGNITVYGKWVRIPSGTQYYTVIYESEGKEVGRDVVLAGSRLGRPQDIVRSGYRFDGWYKDNRYSAQWDFDKDIVDDDITLYAKWVSVGNNSNRSDRGRDNRSSFTNRSRNDSSNDAEGESINFFDQVQAMFSQSNPNTGYRKFSLISLAVAAAAISATVTIITKKKNKK